MLRLSLHKNHALIGSLMFLSLLISTSATSFQMPFEFTKTLDKRCSCESFTKPYPEQFETITKEIENPLIVKRASVLYRAIDQWLQSWQLALLTDRQLREAIKLFMATEELQHKPHCDYCSFKILYLNLLSARSYNEDSNRVTLIPKMMRSLARKYARHCAPNFPETYRDLAEDLDADTQRRVSLITERLGPLNFKDKSLTVYEALESSSRPLSVIAKSSKFSDRTNVGEVLLDTMFQLDRLNPKNTSTLQQVVEDRKLIRTRQSVTFFKELLLEPCRKYVEHFGGQVFFQAEYMFSTIITDLNDMDSLLPKGVAPKVDFYPAWFSYRICIKIIDSSLDIGAKVMVALNEKQHLIVDSDGSSDDELPPPPPPQSQLNWRKLFSSRS